MKPFVQNKIEFNNTCNCIVDYKILEDAIIWYSKFPVFKNRKIYLHGCYPCVSIYNKKIHVHRLLISYVNNRILTTNEYCHHIDNNKLNANIDNLIIVNDKIHQSLHNAGKTLSLAHRAKISKNNTKRKGIRHKNTRQDILPINVYELKIKGLSFNRISKMLNLDWSCTVQRYKDYIYENPEL